MWRLVILFGALLTLAGCAHGMAGSPVRYCTTTMGYARGTSEYKACMDVQLEPYRQMDRANMRAGLSILGGVLQGYGEAASQGSGPNRVPLFVCPDGRYVSSGQCFKTPAGGYVGGPPRIAPNGSYVGGTGSIIVCPDGTYVAGSRCYWPQTERTWERSQMTIVDLRNPDYPVSALSDEDFVIFNLALKALTSGDHILAEQILRREADRDPQVFFPLFFSRAWG